MRQSLASSSNATLKKTRILQINPLIIGHRGASALAPENTLAAFSRALDDGADGIELDVRLARDGVPVVIHDGTLQRTGLTPDQVARMTSDELARIDVGIWFNRKRPALAREEYRNQTVAKLRDVFQLLSGGCVIYVEIKTDGASATELVRAVTNMIVAGHLQKRAVVVSFDHEALAEAKALAPSIRTGALFAPRRRPSVNWHGDAIFSAAADCGADELLLHRLLARAALVEHARNRGLTVVVWTVDDPLWVRRAARLGIHALITNNPAKMLAAAQTSL